MMLDADCLITAAGFSSRMGTWKMMLPYREGTILDQSIKNALAICQRVILVTGFQHEQLIERYQATSTIKMVYNSNYCDGLLSSIQCGLSVIASEYFFITHGDMPCIEPAIYHKLWQYKGDYSVFPCYQNKLGHPVLLPKTIIKQINQLPPQAKLRDFLLKSACQHIEVATPTILQDIDTIDDYYYLIDF